MNNDLAYFQNLTYDTLVHKKGDIYAVTIPELSLLEKDSNLENAYSKLELRKESYFKQMLESELEEYIPLPKALKNKENSLEELVPWLIKTTYKGFIVFIIVWLLGIFVVKKINEYRLIVIPMNNNILTKIKEQAKKIKELPEDEKNLIKEDLKIFATEIKNIWPK